ncbi:hypothetical protein [Microcoleus vaginatus]
MAKIPPDATAVVAAIISPEKWLKSVYPNNAAIPEITAIAPQTPKT